MERNGNTRKDRYSTRPYVIRCHQIMYCRREGHEKSWKFRCGVAACEPKRPYSAVSQPLAAFPDTGVGQAFSPRSRGCETKTTL